MDISQYRLEDAAVMPVRHLATGQPIKSQDGSPVTITIACKDSDQFRRVLREQTDRRLKRTLDTHQRPSADEIEAEAIELLAGCTIGWSGLQNKGKEFPFSLDNARSLYRELPWLRDQVDAFVSDRANFLKASAKS